MKAHADYRDRVFLQPRPLDYYVDALERRRASRCGACARRRSRRACSEWFEFLSAYHDAVLGWVGGTQRIDGAEPTPGAVRDRLQLIRHAMETLFGGRPTFNACWTYITARKPD